MIKKSEFVIGMVIMFVLFLFVNMIIVGDINETMRTLKRPVVLHDTTSVMRYIDRYIHDTTVITQTKTEYIEKGFFDWQNARLCRRKRNNYQA